MPTPVTRDIYELIDREFDTANTSLASAPEIHTGKWSRDQRLPAIAVHSQEGGPVDAGDTGATAFDGAGGGFHQREAGQVAVDCVAGSREDLEGVGTSGQNLNPKQVRYELYAEVQRILTEFRPSTLDTCLPGDFEDRTSSSDETNVQPLFSRRVPALYTYDP